jgi:hypothetical protein
MARGSSTLTAHSRAGRRRSGLPPSPVGTAGKMQVRSRNPLSTLSVRQEQGVEDATGQERSFDGPGRLAGEHHLRDAVHEQGEVSGGPGFLGPEPARLNLPAVLRPPRRGPCADCAIQFEQEGPKAIFVFDDHELGVRDGLAVQRLPILMGWSSPQGGVEFFDRKPVRSRQQAADVGRWSPVRVE